MTAPPRKIAIIDAHPDPDPARFGHALVENYAEAARQAGHEIRIIKLGGIDIPMLQSRKAWEEGTTPASVKPGQDAMLWADHVVFCYPLWLGDMPALLKAFLEHALKPGVAMGNEKGQLPKPLLKGKTSHVIVTMGMPAIFYKAYYGAHSVRSFKRNILKFVGMNVLNTSIIGNVEGSDKHRQKWLERMAERGRAGD